MGFGKAFGLSLIIYIALNFVFGMLIALLGTGIDLYFAALASAPMTFVASLFNPILYLPGEAWITNGIMPLVLGTSDLITTLMVLLAAIIPPLLAAIIAGRTGEGKGSAFGAWFLTAIICSVILLVLGMVDGSLTLDLTSILALILPAVINGIFYGAFAAVSASEGF